MTRRRPSARSPLAGKKVWVAGHRGMVGSALLRRLAREDCEVVTVGRQTCDLRRQAEVERWLSGVRPDLVVVAAARVGGILANATHPAEFLYDNLMIEANVLHAAWQTDVEKLLFLGSSCIYPKHAPQPMAEESLLEGQLEPTNQWYAIAKIAGIKLCQAYRRQYGCNFISAMPTNLYGPGDNFDLATSHVLPALLAKMHAARQAGADAVEIWGTGRPRREFLHVDDLADACVHLLATYSGELHVNVGTGHDMSIADLAERICEVVGFRGQLSFNPERPDGAAQKLLDISRLRALGWQARISFDRGLADTYRWYCEQVTLGGAQQNQHGADGSRLPFTPAS